MTFAAQAPADFGSSAIHRWNAECAFGSFLAAFPQSGGNVPRPVADLDGAAIAVH